MARVQVSIRPGGSPVPTPCSRLKVAGVEPHEDSHALETGPTEEEGPAAVAWIELAP